MIGCFRGKWAKLGNYSPCLVFYEDHAYNSIEHAYQAQKSLDPAIQKLIRDAATPAVAKKLARKVILRPDWETFKLPLMQDLLLEKFSQEPERSILLSTGYRKLVEGNWWHDNFWGDCWCEKCKDTSGENHLGQLLMSLRTTLSSENS